MAGAVAEDLILIRDERHVRTITLNRPEKRNALNAALTSQLIGALEAADSDSEVRCIMLRGAGPSFCAGQDLTEMAGGEETVGKARRLQQTRRLHGLLRNTRKPLVAAVQGGALGGGAALMLGCDMVVAGKSLKFGYPEVPKGVVPGIVVASLVRHMGPKQGFRMIAQGAILDAEEAMRFNLVNRAVNDDQLESAAMELAQELARIPVKLIAEVKTLFYRVMDIPYEKALDAGLELIQQKRG